MLNLDGCFATRSSLRDLREGERIELGDQISIKTTEGTVVMVVTHETTFGEERRPAAGERWRPSLPRVIREEWT